MQNEVSQRSDVTSQLQSKTSEWNLEHDRLVRGEVIAFSVSICCLRLSTHRHTHRHTETHTHRHTDTDRHTQIHRHTHRHTHMHTQNKRESRRWKNSFDNCKPSTPLYKKKTHSCGNK